MTLQVFKTCLLCSTCVGGLEKTPWLVWEKGCVDRALGPVWGQWLEHVSGVLGWRALVGCMVDVVKTRPASPRTPSNNPSSRFRRHDDSRAACFLLVVRLLMC